MNQAIETHPDSLIYRRMSKVLGYGVVAALVSVIVGLVITFFLSPAASADSGRVAFPGLGGLFQGLLKADPTSFIFLGVVIILALPPMQALVALVSFFSQGNRRIGLAALGVLGVQVLALVVAFLK